MTNRRRWSYDEIVYLRESYGKIICSEIANNLNRTIDSVYNKAHYIGLKSNITKSLKKRDNPICTTCGTLLIEGDNWLRSKSGWFICHICELDNRKAYRDKNRTRMRQRDRIYKVKKRKELFNIMGNKCVKCGFSDWRALQIDHIHGTNPKDKEYHGGIGFIFRLLKLNRDELHRNYQLLCANCNWIKRYENKEIPRKD